MTNELPSIWEIEMRCTRCGKTAKIGECEPCVDEDGNDGTGFGCPVPDCGGVMAEVKP